MPPIYTVMLGLFEQERAGTSLMLNPPKPAPELAKALEKDTVSTESFQGPDSKPEPLSTEAWISEALEKESAAEAVGEFELVVGRQQIATWLFLGMIVIAATATFSYLAGKAAKPGKPSAPISGEQTPQPKPAHQAETTAVGTPATPGGTAPPEQTTLPQASIARMPAFGGAPITSNKPIFAEPEVGKIYLQIGAVSKGMAVILAEGLRSHGCESFVAPGPSANVFRVLIGPLKDPAAFTRAKAEIDSIDLGSFVRRYEKTADDSKPVAVAMPSSPPK
jgi:hypothetical protein